MGRGGIALFTGGLALLLLLGQVIVWTDEKAVANNPRQDLVISTIVISAISLGLLCITYWAIRGRWPWSRRRS